jgi:hypothetical protein
MNNKSCEYCNTDFKTLSSLNLHKKKAIYCLKIQGKIPLNNILESFKCEFCNKMLTSKRNLDNHVCNIIELKKNIIELKENISQLKKDRDKCIKESQIQIKDFKDTIERLASQAINKPTTTNNTTNNTLNIMSSLDFNNIDRIKDLIDDNYNINYAIDGQKGLARFVVDNLLKDENGELIYVCTDPSRQIFKYKDNSGEIKKDVEAKKLTNYIVDGGIKKKTIDVSNEWYTDDKGGVDTDKFNLMIERQQNILKLQDDNNNFKKELATITVK